MTNQEAYNELALYTLGKGDPEFIHQYIVDAFAAQNADADTKPITLYFALAGLYLHLEKNYTGRQVQLSHMKMAKSKEGAIKKDWPRFDIPANTGSVTVQDVLPSSEGERDEMINKWSASLWQAYKDSQQKVIAQVNKDLNPK